METTLYIVHHQGIRRSGTWVGNCTLTGCASRTRLKLTKASRRGPLPAKTGRGATLRRILALATTLARNTNRLQIEWMRVNPQVMTSPPPRGINMHVQNRKERRGQDLNAHFHASWCNGNIGIRANWISIRWYGPRNQPKRGEIKPCCQGRRQGPEDQVYISSKRCWRFVYY